MLFQQGHKLFRSAIRGKIADPLSILTKRRGCHAHVWLDLDHLDSCGDSEPDCSVEEFNNEVLFHDVTFCYSTFHIRSLDRYIYIYIYVYVSKGYVYIYM